MGAKLKPASDHDPLSDPIAEYGDSDEHLDKLIEMTRADANWAARDANQLCHRLEELTYHPRWAERIEGEPKTWERFYNEVLGWPADFLARLREGIGILCDAGKINPSAGEAVTIADRAIKAAKATARETLPTAGQGARNDLVNLTKCTQTERASENGIARTTQKKLDRIARDRPDLREQIIAGKLSIDGAFIEAGWKRRTFAVPEDPLAAARILREKFAGDRLAALIRALGGIAQGEEWHR
jgi:hypothetical protein